MTFLPFHTTNVTLDKTCMCPLNKPHNIQPLILHMTCHIYCVISQQYKIGCPRSARRYSKLDRPRNHSNVTSEGSLYLSSSVNEIWSKVSIIRWAKCYKYFWEFQCGFLWNPHNTRSTNISCQSVPIHGRVNSAAEIGIQLLTDRGAWVDLAVHL